MTSTPSSDLLVTALTQLRLYGRLARIDEIRNEPWLERVVAIEHEERTRRSLVHRSHLAGVGASSSRSSREGTRTSGRSCSPTNKAFDEWSSTFPNAACVVALVDRLINRADIIAIDGDRYRLREAEERQKARAMARKGRKEKRPATIAGRRRGAMRSGVIAVQPPRHPGSAAGGALSRDRHDSSLPGASR